MLANTAASKKYKQNIELNKGYGKFRTQQTLLNTQLPPPHTCFFFYQLLDLKGKFYQVDKKKIIY